MNLGKYSKLCEKTYFKRKGKVVNVVGLTIESNGPDAKLDDLCRIIVDEEEDRIKPEILNGSRRSRIAAGAGVKVQDVNQLIQKFNQTKKMLKKLIPNFEQVPANTGKRLKRK